LTLRSIETSDVRKRSWGGELEKGHERYVVFVTSLSGPTTALIEWYNDRWDIENGYKSAKRFMTATTSKHFTTNGGTSGHMSIREVTEITPDGEHDYLAPYGGRRGVGDVPYRADPVLAQTAPRHRSIETTSKTAAPTPKPGKQPVGPAMPSTRIVRRNKKRPPEQPFGHGGRFS
jgi:hypothetical protein